MKPIQTEIKTIVEGIVSYRKTHEGMHGSELERYRENLNDYLNGALNRDFRTDIDCNRNMSCIQILLTTCTDKKDIKKYLRNSEYAHSVLREFYNPFFDFYDVFQKSSYNDESVCKAYKVIQELLHNYPHPTPKVRT